MRERASDFISDGLGINTFYETSAIGARVCFYTLIQEQSTILGWWNLDVLSLEGEQRLQEAVAHVKVMRARLGVSRVVVGFRSLISRLL